MTLARESVALHEAAHFTVARALGGRDCRCELHPDGGGATYFRGVDPLAMLAVLRAGALGEARAFGSEGFARDDRRRFEELLATWHEAERQNARRDAEQVARDVLAREWELVLAIAERLIVTWCWPDRVPSCPGSAASWTPIRVIRGSGDSVSRAGRP